uniref:Palmitoyltransferase n=1 Tax=Trichogramma kaykai TaxID=54128 RepID=A0ABD2WTX7_9HYME
MPRAMRQRTNNMDTEKRDFCWQCIRICKWFPVLFILTITAWSYYAFVVPFCMNMVSNKVAQAIYLIIFHIFFILLIWSYWKTVATNLIKIPEKFILQQDSLDRMQALIGNNDAMSEVLNDYAKDLPVVTRTIKGEIRFCEYCKIVKPDRCHHCSVCSQCVLKMDHHCPWVNNCVGFHNYKFFILFLGYATLYTLFISLTTLEHFIIFFKVKQSGPGTFHVIFLFIVAGMFFLSLSSLFFYHCFLTLNNRTTLEAFRHPVFRSGKDRNGFSLGKLNNFQEVFGDIPRLWFLPIFTSLGNGWIFPIRQVEGASNTYDSMGNTQNSFGDGVSFPERQFDEDQHTLLGVETHRAWPNGGTAADETELDSPTIITGSQAGTWY